jgi:HAD superfamily hydrolase (TIGR01509 family)
MSAAQVLDPHWDAVIFDCDGVLVDSEPVSNRIFQQHLAAIGLEMSLEQTMETFVGRSLTSCVEIIEARLGRSVPDGFLDRLDADTFRALAEEVEPVTGIEAVLAALDCATAVASSGSHEKMRVTLTRTGLRQRFAGRVFSAAEVARGKPYPDLFLYVADRLDVDPSRCAVIEDSRPGVQAAVAAGMAVFGYAARGQSRHLADAGAIVFDDMHDLPGLLLHHARSNASA